MDINMQVLISLTTLFPNITSLMWDLKFNELEHNRRWLDHRDLIKLEQEDKQYAADYEQAITKWKNLENIKCATHYLVFTLHLLRSPGCYEHLRHLEITFNHWEEEDTTDLAHPALKLLLGNNHNAPLLEHIILSHIERIGMADLEPLHEGAPLLQILELGIIHQMQEDTVLVKEPAHYLHSFSTSFSGVMEFGRVNVRSLMRYIGQKYQDVSKLSILEVEECKDPRNDYIFSEYLPNAICSMKNLTSHAVDLVKGQFDYEILEIMEKNGVVQLQYAKLFLEDIAQAQNNSISCRKTAQH
jgi:hypothetical protein